MTATTADVESYVHAHGLASLLNVPGPSVAAGPAPTAYAAVDPANTSPIAPNWPDLVRLHRLVLDRRVTTVLELGCGFSTVVMAHALHQNQLEHGAWVAQHLRRADAFSLHSVDDIPGWIEVTRTRVPDDLRDIVHLNASPVHMTTFNGRIATEYETLPNVCPDLIYVDGPSQFDVIGAVNGISTRHPDRVPMSCDVLRIEHFLLPGTLIVVDGRTANARFLKANLQRAWSYHHDREGDVHLFELTEEPLGRYNEAQLRFSAGGQH
jgi:hypothetical protein